ncbi:MAG: serine hydrolase domain-containing protein [Bacteroidota bacterium]
MKIQLTLICLLVVFNSLAQVKTDNPLKSKTDSIVHRAALVYMSDTARVGLSIGVIANGKSYIYNYGRVSPQSASLPSAHSLYEIGSITKTFTALMVAHGIAEKKMDLNEDIRKYLKGNYPNLQYGNGEPVKLVYLLAHIGRFPRFFTKPVDAGFTTADLDNELHQIKLDTLKPYRYQYSNAGYQLLGQILENVYGQTYDELLKRYITGPLQMVSTKVNIPATDAPWLLNGYNAKKQIMPAMANALPGAGSIKSNMQDMLKYMDYQLKEPDAVVKTTHRPLYGTPETGENAMPWVINRNSNWDYFIREDGGTRGQRCFMAMFPDYQVGILLLSNQTDDNAGEKLYEAYNAIFNALKK